MSDNIIKSMDFINYIVKKIEYNLNSDFKIDNGEKKINVSSDFQSIIYTPSNDSKINNGIVDIIANIGDFNNDNTPFNIIVRISGFFKFSLNDTDNVSFEEKEKSIKDMLALNGNAILFPYLRSLIGDISIRSNKFPAYILPTMNFVEILKESNKLKFEKKKF